MVPTFLRRRAIVALWSILFGIGIPSCNAQETIPPTPLGKYLLLDCSTSKQEYIPDAPSVLGPLTAVDPSRIHCDNSTGVRLVLDSAAIPGPLQTHDEIEPLAHHFADANGISISLWFSPAAYAGQVQPIFTLGGNNNNDNDHNDPSHPLGCPGYGLQIAQVANVLHMSYWDNDAAMSCRTLVAEHYPLVESSLVHMVLSIGNATTAVTVNGQAVYQDLRNNFDTTLSAWEQGGPLSLQLLTNHASGIAFRGSISQVAVFDSPLSLAESQALFRYGLTGNSNNSIPLLTLDELPPISIPQDATSPVEITVTGDSKLSAANHTVAIEFLQVPKHGKLSILGSSSNHNNSSTSVTTLVAGTRIPFPGPRFSISLWYELNQTDKFTTPKVPNVSIDEGFTIRLVSGTAETDFHTSPEVSRVIEIVHVNSNLVLNGEESEVVEDNNFLAIRNIRISNEADYDLDRIRIQLSVSRGLLTLDVRHRHLADFLSCQLHAHWQCSGVGLRDRLMTFLATPSDAQLILANLLYEPGYGTMGEDVVEIQAWDGEEGECLTSDDHDRYSIFRGIEPSTIRRSCYRNAINITLPPFDFERESVEIDGQGGISGWLSSRAEFLDWKVAIYSLVAVTLINCCCFFKLIIDLYAHCMARGSSVDVLEAPPDDESVVAYSDWDDEEIGEPGI